ncbi:MAG: DNA cytosine methyltransferase [Thermoguttaceae bacterium]|nr:DNA cytosine methyltransferase [Thermoguttaceae bacterium]
MENTIPVVDIFAGPGGLSEGFSSFRGVGNESCFDIVLSIEKETNEVHTLIVRAIYRLLCQKNKTDIYYKWFSSKNPSLSSLIEILNDDIEIIEQAKNRVLKLELGKKNSNSSKDKKENNITLENYLRHIADSNKSWILVGGPPCQAYSLAGRVKNKSLTGYKPETDPRFQLYKQYITILTNYKPAIFLLENVQGILSAKYKGESVIEEILRSLEFPKNKKDVHYIIRPLIQSDSLFDKEYAPCDYLIPSEKFGIPQRRHRLIIMGIRDDIAESEYFLNNQSNYFLKYQNLENSVSDMISDIPAIRSHISSSRRYNNNDIKDSLESWKDILKSVQDEEWYKNLDPNLLNCISKTLKDIANFGIKNKKRSKVVQAQVPDCLKWIKGDCTDIVQHESRSHMPSDLFRYLFAACYAKVYNRSPKLCDFPEELLPNHANVNSNKFVDRFHVQLENQPSSTITSHISKDGHYFIHPDPVQCRSLTVREAARLQTFPDNYFFCGDRTSQFHQVGNAVPPYLAKQIAEIIYNILWDSQIIHK